MPLLADTTFCPYCERWLDEPGPVRRRDPSRSAGRLAIITERALLTAGFVFFAAVAIVCVVAALLI